MLPVAEAVDHVDLDLLRDREEVLVAHLAENHLALGSGIHGNDTVALGLQLEPSLSMRAHHFERCEWRGMTLLVNCSWTVTSAPMSAGT